MFKHTVARLRLAGVSLMCGVLSQERVEGWLCEVGLRSVRPNIGHWLGGGSEESKERG